MGRGENSSSPLTTSSRSRDGAQLAARLLSSPPLSDAPGEVAILSLAGSRAYGLEREDSDWDVRGVYVARPELLLGITPPPDQLEGSDGDDLVVFELAKIAKLAVKSNPNIFEILWTPTLYLTDTGREIQPLRELALSQQIRKSYTGFAISQKKLIARHIESGRERQAKKAALHMLRLIKQGGELLRDQKMSVRVSDAEELKARADDPERVAAELDQALMEFDEIPSELPERPDINKISELVINARARGIVDLSVTDHAD